jgi:hypothetical protein
VRQPSQPLQRTLDAPAPQRSAAEPQRTAWRRLATTLSLAGIDPAQQAAPGLKR